MKDLFEEFRRYLRETLDNEEFFEYLKDSVDISDFCKNEENGFINADRKMQKQMLKTISSYHKKA